MKLWIWRHLRIELPDDWEMLRFARSFDRGSCLYADRHQYRLEISWNAVSGPPDFERMISDYAGNLRDAAEGANALVESARHGKLWHGLEAVRDGRHHSRYGSYLAEEACLVEAVMLWPGTRDATLLAAVLDRVAVEPLDAASRRRWVAFGIDAQVPEKMLLTDCEAKPAAASFRFETAGRSVSASESFTRFGMRQRWMTTTVQDWLRNRTGLCAAVPLRTHENRGHSIFNAIGMRHRSSVHAGRRYVQAAAWICPHDDRLYCWMRETRKPETPLAFVPLTCCDALRRRS